MRIIGGEFRGRRLKAPKGRNTRPTPDRVREALFQVLADRVPDARVLELFGGTGSLGLESLSRGAARAVFTETNRDALACLTANVETLGVADRVTIHRKSAFRLPALTRGAEPFDLVFADPPFRMLSDGEDRHRLAILLADVPLAPDGLLVVEHRAGVLGDFCPPSLALAELRKWGTTGMALFHRSPTAGTPDSA
ncbi:MAG: 16S rRNA (guanine(966)-N(2))-methyltransferase RsmD [Planctomycetota bacterium]